MCEQKASFFDCLLDMAGHLGGNSRAGSLSLEGAPLMADQESHEHGTGHEESSLATLARRNTTKRNRSIR